MKKLLILSLMFVLTLSACDSQESVSVIVPNGAPALSQIEIENSMKEEEDPRYVIDKVYGADPLVSAFGSESHDIIIAPTNLGAKLYKAASAPYKFAGTVTWGNLYLASSGKLESFEDLNGKSIIAFGKSATPDIVLQAILKTLDLESEPDITYVESVDGALARLSEDSDAIALVAEPALSAYELKQESLNTLDMQNAWLGNVSETLYPQAGVFVRDDLSEETVNHYLSALKESTTLVNDNVERVGEMAESLDYPFPKALMDTVIPRSNINFKSAAESKESLVSYFNVIKSFNPALIGQSLPEDTFYYDSAS